MYLVKQLKEQGIPYLYSVRFNHTWDGVTPTWDFTKTVYLLPNRYFSINGFHYECGYFDSSGHVKQAHVTRDVYANFSNSRQAVSKFMKITGEDSQIDIRIHSYTTYQMAKIYSECLVFKHLKDFEMSFKHIANGAVLNDTCMSNLTIEGYYLV
jgi:hypothetical protein